MKSHIFIHGKNTNLSQYELRSVLGNEISYQHTLFTLRKDKAPLPKTLMDKLGGTIKICEVFENDPISIIKQFAKTDKILFAISQYGAHEKLSGILLGVKNKLKKAGRNARFLNKDYSNISSGQLNKSKILEKGIDLVRCFVKGTELWARTIAFQDIDSYSKRDYEKPKRDMKVGMMPPKLAQIMINMARPGNSTTIYDPFCGLGTTLIEGVLRGNPVIGSDIKGRLIDATMKNLTWLSEEFSLPSNFKVKSSNFFQHDATQVFPSKKFPQDIVLVTESYLGPTLLHFPETQKKTDIFDLLHGINSQFFFHVSKIIPKGSHLVISFPFFRSGEKKVFYPEEYLHSYEGNSFRIENKLRSLLYERKTQVIGREIFVFERL